jgi:hypothetical protein
MEVNVLGQGDRKVAPPCSNTAEDAPTDQAGSREVRFNPLVASRLVEVGETQETFIDQQRVINDLVKLRKQNLVKVSLVTKLKSLQILVQRLSHQNDLVIPGRTPRNLTRMSRPGKR